MWLIGVSYKKYNLLAIMVFPHSLDAHHHIFLLFLADILALTKTSRTWDLTILWWQQQWHNRLLYLSAHVHGVMRTIDCEISLWARPFARRERVWYNPYTCVVLISRMWTWPFRLQCSLRVYLTVCPHEHANCVHEIPHKHINIIIGDNLLLRWYIHYES